MALLFEIWIYHQQIQLQNNQSLTQLRKNCNLKKGITCTFYIPQVSGTDTDNGFMNCLNVLQQHSISKSNLSRIVAANPPTCLR